MSDERMSRAAGALLAGYWTLTAAWTGLLGRHLGGLLAYRPEADRAALILLLTGPLTWGLAQGLGQRRMFPAFARAAALTAVFTGLFAEGADGHATVLTAAATGVFALVSGTLGASSCGVARLVARLRGRCAADGFRPTRHLRFCFETLFAGAIANVLARVFLWRARIERPVFDPIEYPTAYSRSMDLWTWGYLCFAAGAALYLVWRAVRLRRQWDVAAAEAAPAPEAGGPRPAADAGGGLFP